jgi:hypothetical protein
MGAIDSLPQWDGGEMGIELEDNNCVSFTPGSKIKGVVHIS